MGQLVQTKSAAGMPVLTAPQHVNTPPCDCDHCQRLTRQADRRRQKIMRELALWGIGQRDREVRR